MAILSGIAAGIASAAFKNIFGSVVSEVGGIWKAYLNKEISEAERDAKIAEVQAKASTQMHEATMKAGAEMWSEFQQTVRAAPIVQRAYIAVMVSQMFVLLWWQWGAEAFVRATGAPTWAMPSEAATTATTLLVVCLGGGPFVFKQPGGLRGLLGK